MKKTTRSGSAIIYCIGLSALAVVVGYSFLRATIKDLESGDGGHQYQLAQEAARAGTAHALECMIEDFTAASLPVGSGNGGSTLIANPPSFLDGPYRAPFTAFSAPNRVSGDYNAGDADDDLRAENMILSDLMPKTGSWTGRAQTDFHTHGDQIDPGRGRFHEVNWTNLSRGAPSGAAPVPVAPVRFSDVAPGIPERSDACFLNRDFTRISSGDPQADRLRARYRLRYSVSTEDLEGHLLANPIADMDDNAWAGNPGYRSFSAPYANIQHGWYNMVSTFAGLDPTTPLRAEQVFLGRGNSSNCDRSATGFPVSFPMMFRSPDGYLGRPWWGYYSLNSAFRDTAETNALFEGCTPAGGDPMPDNRGTIWTIFSPNTKPIMHSWTGPQYSWINLHSALRGYYDGWFDDGANTRTGGDLSENATLPTIIGRPLRANPNPAQWGWQDGRVDTPWRVNLLTAPARTIHSMLVAYLPPTVKVLKLTREQFFKYGGIDADGRPIYTSMGPPVSFAPNAVDVSIHGRDLFTDLAGPAFGDYAPPSSPGIVPNFQIPDLRPSELRYPGKLWNDNDDFGKTINVNDVIPIGRCSHTAQPFIYDFSAQISRYSQDGPTIQTTKPAGWGNGAQGGLDRLDWTLDPAVYKFADSYWWDLINAFTSAIATVRAEWVQYPTSTITPSAAFTPAAFRDPSQFQNLAALDRLFLRQLGENFDTPGDGIPLPSVDLQWGAGFQNMRFVDGGVTVSHTIRSLMVSAQTDYDALAAIPAASRTPAQNAQMAGLAEAPDRARLMEKVLNDMRLSFLGADPSYSEQFRPLDFDGDGKVHCSGYIADPGASVAAIENGVQHWKDVDAGYPAPGRGPAPEQWFSLSGCFTIGKSRIFRVHVRGEVFDNLIRIPVADATLESVVVIDADNNGNMVDTRTLFQRWHHNPVNSHLPRHQD